MPQKDLYCTPCGKPATWVRRTQFSGIHPFCTDDAKKEEDFGKSDDSYFFWEEIPSNQVAPKHRIAVEGYEDRLPILVERIHRMRYDKVEEFCLHVAAELRKQAQGDRAKGRHQLADLLEEAAITAEQQQERFTRIWALCKPHM